MRCGNDQTSDCEAQQGQQGCLDELPVAFAENKRRAAKNTKARAPSHRPSILAESHRFHYEPLMTSCVSPEQKTASPGANKVNRPISRAEEFDRAYSGGSLGVCSP